MRILNLPPPYYMKRVSLNPGYSLKKIMEESERMRYVVSEIRSFDERFRIAHYKGSGRKEEKEWNCWSENSLRWKRRRNYTAVFFFLLRRPKVTRVTRVCSNDVCSSRELVFRGNYNPTVFGNWTNPKNVPRDLLWSRTLARFWRTRKNGHRFFFHRNQKLV